MQSVQKAESLQEQGAERRIPICTGSKPWSRWNSRRLFELTFGKSIGRITARREERWRAWLPCTGRKLQKVKAKRVGTCFKMKYSWDEGTTFREEQTSETAGKRKFPETAWEDGTRDGNLFPGGKTLKVKAQKCCVLGYGRRAGNG